MNQPIVKIDQQVYSSGMYQKETGRKMGNRPAQSLAVYLGSISLQKALMKKAVPLK